MYERYLLPVCPSVTTRYCAKTVQPIVEILSLPDSHDILVFWTNQIPKFSPLPEPSFTCAVGCKNLSIYWAICFVQLRCVTNEDDVLLITQSRLCDQQRSAVGPVIHAVLWPSKNGLNKRWSSPSVSLHSNSRHEQLSIISFRYQRAMLL